MSDLCKRQKEIDYPTCLSEQNKDKTKKYYLVPLKLKKDDAFMAPTNIVVDKDARPINVEY